MPAVPRLVRGFIVGPTGVGKTDVSVAVARALGAEIVSVDSRQIYKRLDLGTAKPTAEQRKRVPHHLLDLLEPTERCSAGRFLQLFRGALDGLRSRQAIALAVGGAGLYVDACLGRFHELPPADDRLRARYLEIVELEGPDALHGRLAAIDPETAGRLAPRDTQRVIRALEVAEATGNPLSRRFREEAPAACDADTPIFYLTRPRRELYERIERRCGEMVARGLPAEVRRLLDSGLPRSAPGLKTVGYAEWIGWALGERTREEAMDLFLRNSRRYAKRQETWFRNRHPERIEIVIGTGEGAEETSRRLLANPAIAVP